MRSSYNFIKKKPDISHGESRPQTVKTSDVRRTRFTTNQIALTNEGKRKQQRTPFAMDSGIDSERKDIKPIKDREMQTREAMMSDESSFYDDKDVEAITEQYHSE
jgi:hypothetical protein